MGKSVKRFQGQLRDVEVLFEAESRQTAELAEKSGLADRRGAALLAELEESNALLDSASRGKKQADAELVAARGSVNDMTAINGKAAADKRKLESAVHTLHAEIDDALAQAKGSEEKAKRAMVDAARLADELRAEQDHTAALEKGKAGLTGAMGELELNLAQANEVAAKGGRSAMAKLENRIHELEIELGAIQAKTGETFKAFQKAERFRTRQEETLKMKHLVLLSMVLVTLASCMPQSLVVTTTGPQCNSGEEECIEITTIPPSSTQSSTTTTLTTSTTTTSTSTTTEKLVATEALETIKFHITSEVQFRYAKTLVESAVRNPDTVAQLASFVVVIPDSAFISAFSMEIAGEEYKARVEEKEKAEKT